MLKTAKICSKMSASSNVRRWLSPLFAVVALTLTFGCESKVKRIVRITNTKLNVPVVNIEIVFIERPEFEPLVKAGEPVKATLDSNGEALVNLCKIDGWASIEDSPNVFYGTSLKPKDIENGGRFRLYGRPPTPDDTNLYPSKYVLEIQKP